MSVFRDINAVFLYFFQVHTYMLIYIKYICLIPYITDIPILTSKISLCDGKIGKNIMRSEMILFSM